MGRCQPHKHAPFLVIESYFPPCEAAGLYIRRLTSKARGDIAHHTRYFVARYEWGATGQVYNVVTHSKIPLSGEGAQLAPRPVVVT